MDKPTGYRPVFTQYYYYHLLRFFLFFFRRDHHTVHHNTKRKMKKPKKGKWKKFLTPHQNCFFNKANRSEKVFNNEQLCEAEQSDPPSTGTQQRRRRIRSCETAPFCPSCLHSHTPRKTAVCRPSSTKP
jgi:hypothetical protein